MQVEQTMPALALQTPYVASKWVRAERPEQPCARWDGTCQAVGLERLAQVAIVERVHAVESSCVTQPSGSGTWLATLFEVKERAPGVHLQERCLSCFVGFRLWRLGLSKSASYSMYTRPPTRLQDAPSMGDTVLRHWKKTGYPRGGFGGI